MKRKHESKNDNSDTERKLKKRKKEKAKMKKEKKKKDKIKEEKRPKEKKKDKKKSCKRNMEEINDDALANMKRMVPMTKEEWEKQQSVVRRYNIFLQIFLFTLLRHGRSFGKFLRWAESSKSEN